jgi:hypothetical protein
MKINWRLVAGVVFSAAVAYVCTNPGPILGADTNVGSCATFEKKGYSFAKEDHGGKKYNITRHPNKRGAAIPTKKYGNQFCVFRNDYGDCKLCTK